MTNTAPSRHASLTDLLEHRVSAAESRSRLSAFPWDEDELVDLTVDHVVAVLTSFVDGTIDSDEVTAWADAVDLRDDVGREPGRETEINDALFVLSSPELLDGDLADAARRLLAELGERPRPS